MALATGGRPASLAREATRSLPGALSKPRRVEVEALARKADGVTGAWIVAAVPLGLPSSGIAHLASGETLIVHDKLGVFQVTRGGKPRRLVERDGLEDIACDPAGRRVFVVSEDEGAIHEYRVRRRGDAGLALEDLREPRRLPNLGGRKNAGWEGIAFLSRPRGWPQASLVCVHEGRPRRIAVLALPDLEPVVSEKLPKRAKRLLPDVAGVAVDAKRGHLFLVSDRSRTIIEFSVSRGRAVALEPLASLALPLEADKKPEGLCLDARGRLWVSLDYEKHDDTRKGVALVIELERAGRA